MTMEQLQAIEPTLNVRRIIKVSVARVKFRQLLLMDGEKNSAAAPVQQSV